MARRIFLLTLAAVIANASAAAAAGDKPATPAAAPPSAAPKRAPLQFMADFFSNRRFGVAATTDPVSILPPGAPRPPPATSAQPAADWAGSAFKEAPPQVPRVLVVPMPRLRPEYRATIAVTESALADRLLPPVAAAAPASVDRSTTGSIAAPAEPEHALPPIAPDTPSVETAPAPPIQAATEPDGLLGDPSSYFAPASTDSEPRLMTPSGVGTPLPRGPGVPAGAAGAPAARGEPFEMVRTLQTLQDQLAQGSVEAQKAQGALRTLIERTFAAAGPEVWRDRRNNMAAVTYVLSGGAPDVLRKVLALEPKPPIDPRLVGGVLAYAEGREKEAGELLGPIDPIDLPASMGAQVAIAQSALVVRADPQKAMRLLAVARLLAPGTLVEEAAIRRQIFIADQLRDDKAVHSLARQYLDRFRNSIYAGNFRARFATALSHMDFINDEAQFPRLDDMLASAEPATRLQLYLTVALASAVKSRAVAARIAAERALVLAAPGSAEQARAQLYHAAALVVGAKTFDAAVSEHGRVDRKLLSPSDRALLDVVGATIAGVRSATDRPNAAPTEIPLAAGGEKENPLMKRAADSLKTADTLLTAAK